MNVQEYIASGVLEAYLLGELSEAQAEEVKAMADKYPEVRAELEAIETTMESISFRTAITPPSQLKQRLVKEIGAVSKDPRDLADHQIQIKGSEKGGTVKYLVAASLAVAMLSSAAAVIFWSKWQNAESRLSQLISQNQLLTENFNQATHQLDRTTGDLEILTGKDYKKIVMKGEASSAAAAVVYWSESAEKVYLTVSFLPTPPEDKQYQLWALVDGQPIDAGIFDLPEDPRSLLPMTPMGDADAFAITLEPRGGSELPTLEQLQVIGEV